MPVNHRALPAGDSWRSATGCRQAIHYQCQNKNLLQENFLHCRHRNPETVDAERIAILFQIAEERFERRRLFLRKREGQLCADIAFQLNVGNVLLNGVQNVLGNA